MNIDNENIINGTGAEIRYSCIKEIGNIFILKSNMYVFINYTYEENMLNDNEFPFSILCRNYDNAMIINIPENDITKILIVKYNIGEYLKSRNDIQFKYIISPIANEFSTADVIYTDKFIIHKKCNSIDR